MNVLKPRETVPALVVDTLSGSWSLADQKPENFTMVVFYRGLHCPICSKYVGELDKLAGQHAAAQPAICGGSSVYDAGRCRGGATGQHGTGR